MDFENTNSVEEGSLDANEGALNSTRGDKKSWMTPKLTNLSVSETMGGRAGTQETYTTGARSA